MALGVGAFWLVISAIKDILRVLHLIDKKAHADENQSTELNTLFSEYTHAHATIKQLSIWFEFRKVE